MLHHYLPPGLRYATLTGYVKDVGVTDWRDGVERLQRELRGARPQADPGRAARPASGSCWSTPIIFNMDRWQRAVDQARAAALGGVQPVR